MKYKEIKTKTNDELIELLKDLKKESYNLRFQKKNGQLEKLHAVRLEWGPPDSTGRPIMKEIEGSEFEISAELVLLAMGFLHPEHEGMLADLDVELDPRGNVRRNKNMMTSVEGVFVAGDMGRGQSLVVWAIAEGREVARAIDLYLMSETSLRGVLSTL